MTISRVTPAASDNRRGRRLEHVDTDYAKRLITDRMEESGMHRRLTAQERQVLLLTVNGDKAPWRKMQPEPLFASKFFEIRRDALEKLGMNVIKTDTPIKVSSKTAMRWKKYYARQKAINKR